MQTELSFLWDLYKQILIEQSYIDEQGYEQTDLVEILKMVRCRIDEIINKQ